MEVLTVNTYCDFDLFLVDIRKESTGSKFCIIKSRPVKACLGRCFDQTVENLARLPRSWQFGWKKVLTVDKKIDFLKTSVLFLSIDLDLDQYQRFFLSGPLSQEHQHLRTLKCEVGLVKI